MLRKSKSRKSGLFRRPKPAKAQADEARPADPPQAGVALRPAEARFVASLSLFLCFVFECRRLVWWRMQFFFLYYDQNRNGRLEVEEAPLRD